MATRPREIDGYRQDAGFTWPDEVPWSLLGPAFVERWGRPDGQVQPEHVEITGQSGSGKTYVLVTLLQERALMRDSSEILIITKKADDTIHRLGWPIVDNWRDLQRYKQVIFWPQTSSVGHEREVYHEAKIYELLTRLWTPEANTVVAFDEIGYIEDLPGPGRHRNRLKRLIKQYWREARSHGITIVAMKQRPIGVVRDQHSESRWKIVFPAADEDDFDRFAELLGPPRDWVPVLRSLQKRQFVIRNSYSREAYISWIDYDVQPIPAQSHPPDRTAREYLHGRKKRA
ncbi:hypothetical protein [Amycolatopsis alkalitolerans]|uniref:Uncharacterized protein n=1 Tax=Amycolatopsis alkalitolerans TaxID=2547244 RepID=A0A5C4LRC8_9PSEU|nr:hypothetical protein [Amycolatopsis alkalitolerans]TNC19057.1 hypothetical protein FG385_32845 [Amycolatopsis alkalitolerans]